jgi:hypothetical protein
LHRQVLYEVLYYLGLQRLDVDNLSQHVMLAQVVRERDQGQPNLLDSALAANRTPSTGRVGMVLHGNEALPILYVDTREWREVRLEEPERQPEMQGLVLCLEAVQVQIEFRMWMLN